MTRTRGNILMIGKVVKIADFGLARHICPGQMSRGVRTLCYSAPKVVNDDMYDVSSDIWNRKLNCVFLKYILFEFNFDPFKFSETRLSVSSSLIRFHLIFLLS